MNGVNNIPTAAFNTFVWSDELFLTQKLRANLRFLCIILICVYILTLSIAPAGRQYSLPWKLPIYVRIWTFKSENKTKELQLLPKLQIYTSLTIHR